MDRIERLKEDLLAKIDILDKDVYNNDWCKGKIEGFREVLSFMDSLHEEPVSEELKEAAVNYAEQFMKEVDNVEIEQAKWRNRHPEEPVVHGGIKACFLFQRDAFKAGAKWQKEKDAHLIWQISSANYEKGKQESKEQIMENAIKCEITWMDGFMLNYTQEQQDDLLEKIGAKVGDKVKLVIIKEE